MVLSGFRGNASCGKCKVKLVAGEMNSPKTRHISDDEYAEGWRLACVSKLTGDVEVQVPDIASAYRSRGASTTWEKGIMASME